MMNGTVSQKGWVVIPAELRKKYGIKPGTRLQFVDYGGAIELIPVPDNPVEAAAGIAFERSSIIQQGVGGAVENKTRHTGDSLAF